MKSLFKLFIIFFSLAITLLLESYALPTQAVDTTGYIQNVKNETVVLVSNNILNCEISSAQEENNQNFSTLSPLIIAYFLKDNLFTKTTTQLNGSFIHNLSTDNKKVHPIRAP